MNTSRETCGEIAKLRLIIRARATFSVVIPAEKVSVMSPNSCRLCLRS